MPISGIDRFGMSGLRQPKSVVFIAAWGSWEGFFVQSFFHPFIALSVFTVHFSRKQKGKDEANKGDGAKQESCECIFDCHLCLVDCS